MNLDRARLIEVIKRHTTGYRAWTWSTLADEILRVEKWGEQSMEVKTPVVKSYAMSIQCGTCTKCVDIPSGPLDMSPLNGWHHSIEAGFQCPVCTNLSDDLTPRQLSEILHVLWAAQDLIDNTDNYSDPRRDELASALERVSLPWRDMDMEVLTAPVETP